MPVQTNVRKNQRQQPIEQPTLFVKLKHWFIKGSEFGESGKAVNASKQQSDMHAARATVTRDTNNRQKSPYLTPPLGPRLVPPAVRRNGPKMVNDDALFSLTAAQSHQQQKNTRSWRRKPVSPQPRISHPKPTDSLIDFASGYADVQNPARVYVAAQKPSHAAADGTKEEKRKKPLQEVKTNRENTIAGSRNHGSTRPVVRESGPLKMQNTDNVRSRETRFEDFMGKQSSPPVPSLPTSAHRLSRPFEEPLGYEEPTANDGRASTVALSPSESNAQTWLRYDESQAKPSSSKGKQPINKPLFPPRGDSVQKERKICQSCRQHITPDTSIKYKETFLCQQCATAIEESRAKRRKEQKKALAPISTGSVVRKPLPTPSPRMPFSPLRKSEETCYSSTGSTLQGTPSPDPASRREPRPHRRRDVPPGYEQHLSDFRATPFIRRPSFIPDSAISEEADATAENHSLSYYNTPDASGMYPKYRTPPPPPPVARGGQPVDSKHQPKATKARPPPIDTTVPANFLPPPPIPSTAQREHIPIPASSIYPEDETSAPPLASSRLSRPPMLPYTAVPGYVSRNNAVKGKNAKSRDTIASVIGMYVDKTETEDGEVSPLSSFDGEGGRESVVSPMGEYAPPAWRVGRR